MITLQQVSRIFEVGGQRVAALDSVDLQIDAGEYVSIMGPSGSGKSTLLNLLGLLDSPSNGHYLLAGQDVTTLDERQQAEVRAHKIGFVFQSFHLIPRMSAAQNIELPMMLAGVEREQRRARVAQLLSSYGLQQRADHKPDQLSGGQRQRVAIARATSMQPAILLADEPTGNLDQKTGHEVMSLLEALLEQQVTLIMVTHDQQLGQRAHHQIRMVDGRIQRRE